MSRCMYILSAYRTFHRLSSDATAKGFCAVSAFLFQEVSKKSGQFFLVGDKFVYAELGRYVFSMFCASTIYCLFSVYFVSVFMFPCVPRTFFLVYYI